VDNTSPDTPDYYPPRTSVVYITQHTVNNCNLLYFILYYYSTVDLNQKLYVF